MVTTKKSKKTVVDSEPKWSTQKECMTFTTADYNLWYDIFQCRYYEAIPEDGVDVQWKDWTEPAKCKSAKPTKSKKHITDILTETKIGVKCGRTSFITLFLCKTRLGVRLGAF